MDSNGRTIFVADAHRDDGKRFVVHADEIDCVCGTRIDDSGRHFMKSERLIDAASGWPLMSAFDPEATLEPLFVKTT